MKKTFCDICGKEITPADREISMKIPTEIDEKQIDILDMHSICFAYLKRFVQKMIESEEKINI